MAKSVRCKYCTREGLVWKQLPTGWRMMDPETGAVHSCKTSAVSVPSPYIAVMKEAYGTSASVAVPMVTVPMTQPAPTPVEAPSSEPSALAQLLAELLLTELETESEESPS